MSAANNSAADHPGPTRSVSGVRVVDQSVIRRAVAAAAIGNVTEWFDFGVYGYMATTIGEVFFPGEGATKTLAALATFAAAFIVRPLGGLFFGPLGDRIGRTRVLEITMIMMAIGTFVVGFLPSFSTIGLAAPILLLLARLVQGFSTGGEYGGAMTFIAEYAPDKRRGFLGSFLEFGTLTGYTMGAGIVTILSAALTEGQLLSWGWRIPFLIAGPLGLVGMYLRMRLEETPAFAEIAQESQGREGSQTLREFKRIFVDNWQAMLMCGGLVLAFNVTNYMLTAYMPTFVSETMQQYGYAGMSSDTSNLLQIAVMVVMIVVINTIGGSSDRFGRRPVVLTGSIALVVLSFPAMALILSDTPVTLFLGLLLVGLLLVFFSATMPSTLPALFPTDVRYGGLSVAFNISVALFGGTTPTVMQGLVHGGWTMYWPAIYLVGAGLIGAVSILATKESARRPLPGSSASVATIAEAEQISDSGEESAMAAR